jgi:eukaryotic-like serine/threonine-protein kinase
MSGGKPRVIAGRYRIVAAIGSGGMGAVWHAHDELLGVDVALKEVTLEQGLSEGERAELVTRAMREARNAARLRSNPHVVTIHDTVEHDGLPWIVMDLIPSVSLHKAVRDRGPLPPAEAARIGLAVLDALVAGHDLGVLHRDVKASNVLLAFDGRVLLTDFGIAMHIGDASLTGTGGSVGTPQYMAPERLDGQPATPATDLFALGVTLYGALSGQVPFRGDTPAAVVTAVLFAEPPPLACGEPLAGLVAGLLAKDPRERTDAARARAVLTAVAGGSGTTRLSRPVPAQASPGAGGSGWAAEPPTRSRARSGSATTDRSPLPPAAAGPLFPRAAARGNSGPASAKDQPRRLTTVLRSAAVIGTVAVLAVVATLLVSRGAGHGSGAAATGPAASGGRTGTPGSAPPRSTTGPTAPSGSTVGPTGLVGATAAAPVGPSAVAPGFYGTWQGTVTQGTTSYGATVVLHAGAIGKAIGTSTYASLGCQGRLVLLASTATTLTVDEQLIDTGLCLGSDLHIALLPDGTLSYGYDAGALYSAGHAILRRVG